MGRRYLKRWQATLAALAVASAPQTALGDLSAVDVSQMRGTLTQIEDELQQGVDGPVSVSQIWSRLAIGPDLAAVTAPQDPAFNSNGSLFGEPAEATDTPSDAVPFGQLGTQPAARRDAPLDVGTTNFRLMLASLAQTYTGKNNQAVVNAQGPRGPVALSVRAGTVTLADLQAFSAAEGHPPRADGTLTLPVLIWPDATLRLGPTDRMALARDTGAFVMSMGSLVIDGATIEVSGPKNPHTPSFAPFITVGNGGDLRVENATLRGLGFGQTPKFSGLSVVGNLLNQGDGDIVLRGNLFEQLKVVSLAGVHEAQVTGNTFFDARGNSLNLVNAPHATVENNIFAGRAPTNAIRVDQGSAYSNVSRNIFLAGKRVAVRVSTGSDGVQVRDNLLWKRDGGGVKFLLSVCGLAEGNVILDNAQKGIEVRKSDGTVVRDNLIVGNGSAGVWVSAQSDDARTAVTDNIFAANGAGLSAATGAEILIQGNNFAKQLPRLLSGDIARLTHSIVRDLRGAVPLHFKNGQADTDRDLATLCGSNL